MASKKPPSRMDKRREAEAVEANEKSTAGGKKATVKKGTAKKPTRRKTKQAERKRLIWGVFSGTLREEARFPFNEKAHNGGSPSRINTKHVRAQSVRSTRSRFLGMHTCMHAWSLFFFRGRRRYCRSQLSSEPNQRRQQRRYHTVVPVVRSCVTWMLPSRRAQHS